MAAQTAENKSFIKMKRSVLVTVAGDDADHCASVFNIRIALLKAFKANKFWI